MEGLGRLHGMSHTTPYAKGREEVNLLYLHLCFIARVNNGGFFVEKKYDGRRVLGVSDFRYFNAYWLLCALSESCPMFSCYPCLGGDEKAFSLFCQLRDYLGMKAYPVEDFPGEVEECILLLAVDD